MVAAECFAYGFPPFIVDIPAWRPSHTPRGGATSFPFPRTLFCGVPAVQCPLRTGRGQTIQRDMLSGRSNSASPSSRPPDLLSVTGWQPEAWPRQKCVTSHWPRQSQLKASSPGLARCDSAAESKHSRPISACQASTPAITALNPSSPTIALQTPNMSSCDVSNTSLPGRQTA